MYNWYYKPGQKSMAAEVIAAKREPTVDILLNVRIVKRTSKYLCLCL